MTFRELSVPGAWEITPQLHHDQRGAFYEWFTDREFSAATGHNFDLRQANCSVSTRGVLRGLHFAELPPSQAKYVTCVRGAVFDVVVDIRVGSPTFGSWDSVLLDDTDRRSVYLSEGLAHGFVALQQDSTVMYLCSAEYSPGREHSISPVDPALSIQWPMPASEMVVSEKDRQAGTLDDAHAAGILPSWEATRVFVDYLRARLTD